MTDNKQQDMYYFNTYTVSFLSPRYKDIIITGKFGDKKIIVTFPDGERLFKELEEQRKRNES